MYVHIYTYVNIYRFIYNRNLCHFTTLQYEIPSGMNACICSRAQSLFTNSSPTWEAKISESHLMTLKSEQLEYADFSQLLAVPLGLTSDFFSPVHWKFSSHKDVAGVSGSRHLLWNLATFVKVFRQSA